jgi:uncharacterized phage protein (TIGR02220 family)
MSRRIRSVKPEWLEDERLVLASSDARVLSIALMVLADDEGRGRASPVLLAGQVFPGLENAREVSRAALSELEAIRFVALYEVDGQHYYQIRTWEKHQRIDHPTPSKLPKNPHTSDVLANPRESSREIENPRASRASTPIPSLPDPEGVQGEPEPLTLVPPQPPEPDPVREVFDHWAAVAWPKVHEGGRAPMASDERLRPIRARLADGYTVAQLRAVVDRVSADPFYLGQNERRTPYIEPKTIMRNASKVDELLATAAGGSPRPSTSRGPTGLEDTEQW